MPVTNSLFKISLLFSHSVCGLFKPFSQKKAEWLVNKKLHALPRVQRLRTGFIPGVEGGILVTALGMSFVSSVHSESLKGSH